jgi:hypothetical protein
MKFTFIIEIGIINREGRDILQDMKFPIQFKERDNSNQYYIIAHNYVCHSISIEQMLYLSEIFDISIRNRFVTIREYRNQV